MLDEDRCTFEAKGRPHLVLQKSQPVRAGIVGVVDKYLEVNRVGAGLRRVIHLESFTFCNRWRIFFNGLLDYPIQYTGGDFGSGLCSNIVDGFNTAPNIVSALGRNRL